MTLIKTKNLSLRVDETNPDHHLYCNNGTWWMHYTTHPDALTAKRVRRSLKTKCVQRARSLRDAILSGKGACDAS